MTITLSILGALAAIAATLLLRPRTVSAHCDTMDGPAVKDGQLALETGNVSIALKWVHAASGDELAGIFEQARAVRGRDEQVRAVADRWFLENLVRIHRAGEGAPYTGLKSVGTPIDDRVRAADEAVATGSLAPLAELLPAEALPELDRRFAEVLARQDFADDDVAAGRSYLEAYVSFFKLAEGHDHEHAPGQEHAHSHEHA